MTLSRFVVKNAFRNKWRSALTMVSIAFSLLLLTLMMTIWRSFYIDQGAPGSALRLITRHRVSIANFMPKAYREKVGPEGFAKAPIGAGPYRVVEWDAGTRMELEAFKDFPLGRPKIDRVTYKTVEDTNTNLAAVLAGGKATEKMNGRELCFR